MVMINRGNFKKLETALTTGSMEQPKNGCHNYETSLAYVKIAGSILITHTKFIIKKKLRICRCNNKQQL